ncbi:MAG: hypothetical protein IJ521_01145 [Schwartzia sp.]|nr:hypothetical protein [Schwartzia sp. (in: firmicutes)]
MSYVYYNPNPAGRNVGDCVIRAIAKLTGQTWEEVYIGVSMKGLRLYDMPSSNAVWGAYLRDAGYKHFGLPNHCPDCYTVKEFCRENPQGSFLLATGSHVIAVMDGDYYDAWDSGEEILSYYYQRR